MASQLQCWLLLQYPQFNQSVYLFDKGILVYLWYWENLAVIRRCTLL